MLKAFTKAITARANYACLNLSVIPIPKTVHKQASLPSVSSFVYAQQRQYSPYILQPVNSSPHYKKSVNIATFPFSNLVRQYATKKTSEAFAPKSIKKDKMKKGSKTPSKTGTDGSRQTKIGQFFQRGSTPASPGKGNQTKIGQFFKKESTPGASADAVTKSPLKNNKEEDEIEMENETVTVKNGKSTTDDDSVKVPKAGTKRRSKSTSSEDENVSKKSSSKEKQKPEAKKQRRRIVVEDSSSEEELPGKMEEDEGEPEVEEEVAPKKKSKKSTPSPKAESKEKKKPVVNGNKKDSKITKKKKETAKASPKKPKKEESPVPENKNASPAKQEDKSEKKSNEDIKKPNGVQNDQKALSLGNSAAPKGWNPDYNPAKNKYHPIDDASWEKDQRVPYLALAKTLEAIEATSSRLKNMEILANYFRSVIILSPNDLLMSVYLCLNKLAPAYEGVELGVAETNVMKAIAQATGRSMDKIKADAAEAGDLGIVAEASRSTQKTLFQPPPLTVHSVFHKLKDVASLSGSSSHGKKIGMITSLLVACKYSEARYLARSLLGKLRVGLAEQSLLQAIAQACFLTPPDQDRSVWPPKYLDRGRKYATDALKAKYEEEAYKIKSAFCECPSYDILVKELLENGVDGLAEGCKLTPGIPPRPMLAQPTKGVADVLERFDGIKFTCEYKYDGERAQIHLLEDGTMNIYSRNQENNTSKYPDIISRFKKCIKGDVKSCIIDAEAVAWDIEKESILPFQVLSTRKRKDADEATIKVQVCVFAFDLIYLNGKSLIKESLFARRELLHQNFEPVKGEFVFATSLDTESMEEVQEFLEESVKRNCEGLMVKTLDQKATYELAKRSQKWLKLKKDYLDSGGDSLDLVVIGGFNGKGKRTGTYGGFLLACYDPDEEVFQTICKLGTGFSDENLQQHTESLKPHIIKQPKSYYRFHSQLTPDHWFDAVQVWEVKCADLSLSPVHTAAEGMADSQRGISLRFPRFIRIRDDKNVEDATSSSQVAEMYKSQEVVKNSTSKKSVDDEEDFY